MDTSQPHELVTLHMPMSIRTFNMLLDALEGEWPLSVPVADEANRSIIHVMSQPYGANFAPAR